MDTLNCIYNTNGSKDAKTIGDVYLLIDDI